MSRKLNGWAFDRLDKLEKRLRHQRGLGETLSPRSILQQMNDRAVFEMETKLFRLKNATRTLDGRSRQNITARTIG